MNLNKKIGDLIAFTVLDEYGFPVTFDNEEDKDFFRAYKNVSLLDYLSASGRKLLTITYRKDEAKIILPCPFCSGKPSFRKPIADMSKYYFTHTCKSRKRTIHIHSDFFDTLLEAQQMWNQRD